MRNSEFEDAYEDKERIRGALVTTPVSALGLREPIQIEATAPVAAAVRAMNDHHTGCVLVRSGGKLVGIFTERDVLTKVVFRGDPPPGLVGAVMTRDPETLEPEATLAYALNKMHVGGYRHIPVVDDGKPVGVVSVRDIVGFLVDLFPEDVLNLPSHPDLSIPRTTDGG